MPKIELLSDAHFHQIISENSELLKEITSLPICGIWIQPSVNDSKLWLSNSFWNFMGYTNKDNSESWANLQDTIHSIIEEVISETEKSDLELKRRFVKEDGEGLLLKILVKKILLNNEPGILYRFQRYEAKLNPGDKKGSFQNLIKIFNETNELARVGGWELDLVNAKLSWTRMTKEIHEVPADFVPDLEKGIYFYKEGWSRDKISGLVQEAIENGKSWDAELLLVTAKGREIWVRAMGKPEFQEGKCVRLYGAFQDINRQKIAELQYKTTRERFEKIFQNSSLGIILVHIEGHLILANPASLKIFGFKEAELNDALNLTFKDLIHPNYLKEAVRYRQKLVNGEIENYQMEARFFKITGEEIWCRLTTSIVKGEAGMEDLIISQVEDITERMQLQMKANENSKRFMSAFEYSPNGMGVVSMEGEWLMVNQNLANMFGYTKEEFVNRRSSELTHPKDLKKDSEHLQALINLEIETYSVEKRFIHQSGRIIYGMLYVSVIVDDEGKPLYLIRQIADLTKRILSERALQKSLDEFQGLMDATTKVSIMETDLDGVIQKFNKGAENLLGYAAEEVIGKMNVLTIHTEEEIKERDDQRERFYDAEWTYKRKDGSTFPVKLAITPIKNHKDIITGFLGVAIDITDLKKMEYSLREARKKAEAANKAKSEFLANMSHEIRTPLNGIVGFTDLLMQSNLNSSQEKYMQTVYNSANTLMDLINDVLDFSKIEAGKLELSEERTDLIQLCGQTVDMIKHQAHQKGLEVLLQISPNIRRYVYVDAVRLRQILINLLGNAVKFTHEGEVSLSVLSTNLDYDEDEVVFKFEIRDTGIGIARKNLDKIFNAFDQEDASTTRKYGGSGLGLTISNRLLNLMDSKLNVSSVLGQGSTFYFHVKLRTEQEINFETRPIKDIRKVLIVDDNDNYREILKQMLAVNKIETVLSPNGIDALNKLKENEDFDLAIVDFNMPYLTGIGLIEQIRNKHQLDADKLPVILLHSSTEDEMIQKSCKELDVTFNVTKPIQIAQLYELIENIEEPLNVKAVIPEETFKNTTEEFRIMIVEDNPVNRFLANTIIQKVVPNAVIISAEDGEEAIEKFRENKLDLIFMDIQMPVLSGLEATEEIRNIEKENSHTPIIALTARALKNEREKYLAHGMDDYLTKPVVLEDVKEVIFKFLIKERP
ncbi:PAS domain-containing hybrid sensor histidine kinase/response regulator [Christiangramia portivictoriae]|uniref:PAS domain-containing hybrid sensor histidine kinase/response regulator n=1 Tax=Christiangramia portivictoriae TaxID=326069 RepID=UPI000418C1FF|nr:PAS domain S-box protein [Christiangramia portivictoriae]